MQMRWRIPTMLVTALALSSAGALVLPLGGMDAEALSAGAELTRAPAHTVGLASGCHPSLPSRLESTGNAHQVVSVIGSSYRATYATLGAWERHGWCWERVLGPWTARIGRAGFSNHHHEGDGTTPAGSYAIGPVIYGNAPNPGVKEHYHRLVCGDWWDETPSSPGYNTFQHVRCGEPPPFGGDSEALWTEAVAYPSFATVGYNVRPVVQGAGSAIFIHADIGMATDGCVSLPLGELDELLRWLDPSPPARIVMGPRSEIDRL